jgi:hypothetical protein
MRRSWTVSRALLLAGALSVVLALATLSLFLAVEKRVAAAAPDYRVAAIGGLEYEAMDGRPINLDNAVDRQLVAGLPARDRHLPHGQMLFGAFIAFTNASTRPLRSADRIELRDDGGHVYRSLGLPASNPYAYSPRLVRPGTRIPAQGSPADDNLAAMGRLILFRIPTRRYSDGGTLELVIHQPHQPGRTASLVI